MDNKLSKLLKTFALLKVLSKAKKTPINMTAEEAVKEHVNLVNVLESPSHKDDIQEAKKQKVELKEYKSKLAKGAMGDWQKEGYKISHRELPEMFRQRGHKGIEVIAHDKKGNEVAHARIKTGRSKSTSFDTYVHPDHRRKGLATAMYRHAELKTNTKMHPSGDRTTDGKALWTYGQKPQSNIKFGKGEDLEKSPTRYDIDNVDNVHLSLYPGATKKIITNKIGKDLEHHIKMDPKNKNTVHILTSKNSKIPIAQINIEMRRHDDTGEIEPTVSHSVVNPKHKGQGFGKLLYQHAIKHHGSLTSDSSISARANKMWGGLANKKIGITTELAEYSDYDETPHRAVYYGKTETIDLTFKSITDSFEKSLLDEYSLLELIKADNRPTYRGQAHPNDFNQHADIMSNGLLAWKYTPQASRRYMKDIHNDRQNILNAHPQHQEAIKRMYSQVLAHPDAHFIPTQSDIKSPVHEMRARHLRQLTKYPDSATIIPKANGDITFATHRHSKQTPEFTSYWTFNKDRGMINYEEKDGHQELNPKKYDVSPSTDVKVDKAPVRVVSPGVVVRSKDRVSKSEDNYKADDSLDTFESRGNIPNKREMVGNPIQVEESRDNLLYKSEMKRYLEEISFLENWQKSYLSKSEDSHPTTIYHYGRQPGLKEIDPKFMGTGTSGDFNRKFDPSRIPDYPHSTFAYKEDRPEDIVKAGAKSKYTLKLTPDQELYDISKDPENLVSSAVKENNGIWNIENVFNKIKDSGYYGAHVSSKDAHPVIQNTVHLFYKHPVHQEEGV